MFKEILLELETAFEGKSLVAIPQNEWVDLVYHFTPLLDEHTNFLIACAEEKFSARILDYSIKQPLLYAQAHSNVCNIEVKPKNPLARLQLLMELYRSTYRYPANVSIKLSFYGDKEMEGFRRLLTNYRRPVASLLEKSDLRFETGVVLERLKRYKGKNPIKRLDLYFSEALTEHDYFDLEAEFFEDSLIENVVNTFLAAIALYDSCYFYCYGRRDFDKILDYYSSMNKRVKKHE